MMVRGSADKSDDINITEEPIEGYYNNYVKLYSYAGLV